MYLFIYLFTLVFVHLFTYPTILSIYLSNYLFIYLLFFLFTFSTLLSPTWILTNEKYCNVHQYDRSINMINDWLKDCQAPPNSSIFMISMGSSVEVVRLKLPISNVNNKNMKSLSCLKSYQNCLLVTYPCTKLKLKVMSLLSYHEKLLILAV